MGRRKLGLGLGGAHANVSVNFRRSPLTVKLLLIAKQTLFVEGDPKEAYFLGFWIKPAMAARRNSLRDPPASNGELHVTHQDPRSIRPQKLRLTASEPEIDWVSQTA